MKKTKDWEKEFDEFGLKMNKERVKQFIYSLLTSEIAKERERIKEKIEKIIMYSPKGQRRNLTAEIKEYKAEVLKAILTDDTK